MSERRALLWAGTTAAAVSLAAFLFFYLAGSILYFGDAVAHMSMARKLPKTPGYSQIGTVWLPLPLPGGAMWCGRAWPCWPEP